MGTLVLDDDDDDDDKDKDKDKDGDENEDGDDEDDIECAVDRARRGALSTSLSMRASFFPGSKCSTRGSHGA